ncbi:MAG: hypothetical protein J6D03_00090 [Clostridia bacterium]|nr:hypothetical protein [Clostridia bacterium]
MKQHFLINSRIDKPIMNRFAYKPKNKYDLREIISKHISNGEYDLNDIDTSDIIDMSNLFDK